MDPEATPLGLDSLSTLNPDVLPDDLRRAVESIEVYGPQVGVSESGGQGYASCGAVVLNMRVQGAVDTQHAYVVLPPTCRVHLLASHVRPPSLTFAVPLTHCRLFTACCCCCCHTVTLFTGPDPGRF